MSTLRLWGSVHLTLTNEVFVESASSERLGQAWSNIGDGLIEHCQPDFTRAQNGPFGVTLSRLDRVYSNLPSWRLLGADIRTSTVGNVIDNVRLSDHVCSVTSLYSNRFEGHVSPTPVWVTNDPMFCKWPSIQKCRDVG